MIRQVVCTIIAIFLVTALEVFYGAFFAWSAPVIIVILYKLYHRNKTRFPIR